MSTVEVWVALGEGGIYEVATDDYTALERLKEGSDEELAGTLCRVVKLNVTMDDPHPPADVDKPDKAFDVAVPDDAGRIVEVEK
jgi:hypothetical protein